ncbi:hypothetical protein K432DRAFT_386787, partial [Lepidopterella palustris CBS 459.81]
MAALISSPNCIKINAFCQRKQYHNADTIIEDKLLLFLIEKVIDRPLKAKSRKAADNRLVRGYVTALPREDNIQEYLKSLQHKGRDTLLDGYIKKKFKSYYFCTLVDFLLRYYILTRGGDRRSTEISDLFTFKFKVKALEYVGILSSKITHIMRRGGTKVAELKGLSVLYQAMPLLVDQLKAMDARNAQREARSEQRAARSEQQVAELTALVRRQAEFQSAQSAQLELLTSGSLTFRLEPYPAPAAARQLAPPLSLSLSLAGSSR